LFKNGGHKFQDFLGVIKYFDVLPVNSNVDSTVTGLLMDSRR